MYLDAPTMACCCQCHAHSTCYLAADDKEHGALTSVNITADSATNGGEEKEVETKSEPDLYSDFASSGHEATHAQQDAEQPSKL